MSNTRITRDYHTCSRCEDAIQPRELVKLTNGNNDYVCESCANHEAMLALTLPRGRTASDRCTSCFQIPSSSGECWCG